MAVPSVSFTDGAELSAAGRLSPDRRLRCLCMCENRKRGIESANLAVADRQEPDDRRIEKPVHDAALADYGGVTVLCG